MRFGFHISIAGGFKNVIKRAKERKCETIQLFSRNPRGWSYSPLNPEDVEIFKRELKESNIYPVFIHLPYLPNLGTWKKELYEKSLISLKEEILRAEILGIEYVVMHPGSSSGTGFEESARRIIEGINRVIEETETKTMILLENTSGEGNEIGKDFDEIKYIIEGVIDEEKVGVVLDTAHLFEAGYPIHTADGLEKTLKEFDKKIGLHKLKLLHLNDSKTPLGSKKDRHWHIGEGEIGREGFRRIVNHPMLRDLPGIMETPRKKTGDDIRNMETIKSLVEY